MEADTHVLDFEHFEALQNSGLLDSLYESLSVKERALALYRSQHPAVRQRIRALKKIQYETLKIEVQFYKELAELEKNYSLKHEHLFDKRRKIVSGDYQPSAEESNWFIGDMDKDDGPQRIPSYSNAGDVVCDVKNGGLLSDWGAQDCHNLIMNPHQHVFEQKQRQISDYTKIRTPTGYIQPSSKCFAAVEVRADSVKDAPTGIPGFWLTVLKNAPLTSDLIHPEDQPALQHLVDIRSISLEDNGKIGFQLEFEFEPNEFFTDKVLCKRYFLTYDLKEENPLAYDGPEMLFSEGCDIHWKPNKNLTSTASSQTQKGRIGIDKQILPSSRYSDSFFRFFDSPQSCNDEKSSVMEQKLLEDYDLGQYLKERVIPRAVTYYTGESLDVDQEVDDEDEFPDDEFFDDVEDPEIDRESY